MTVSDVVAQIPAVTVPQLAGKGERHMKNDLNAFIDADITIEATQKGVLDDTTFAVKDVFAIKQHKNAAGNPDWLKTHDAATSNAYVIDQLLNSGATLTGITHTDELMYSLNGENIHYGTPVNPRYPNCIPGGSSSGSAVAAASRMVDFAIGTDTGGSTRIPACYCGIYGFRPSHGTIDMAGIIPLAPSFDTVGWMSEKIETLSKIANVLLPIDHSSNHFQTIYLAEDAWQLIEDNTTKTVLQKQLSSLIQDHFTVKTITLADESLAAWSKSFRLLQGREIWQTHGEWITKEDPIFGTDIADRFQWASTIKEDDTWQQAKQLRRSIQQKLDNLLNKNGLLVIPTTPGSAPEIGRSLVDVENTRTRTMQLSCIAGLSGLPQLTIPITTEDGKAVGLSIIAGRNQDLALLQWLLERKHSLTK